jgi:hypothetical protein
MHVHKVSSQNCFKQADSGEFDEYGDKIMGLVAVVRLRVLRKPFHLWIQNRQKIPRATHLQHRCNTISKN